MDKIKGLDNRISRLSGEMDIWSMLTPVNQEEERRRFFARLASGGKYDPRFIYRDRSGLTLYEKELRSMLSRLRDGDIRYTFLADKVSMLLGQIDMLTSGDGRFGEVSAFVYGAPDEQCIEKAFSIVSGAKESGYEFPEEKVDPVRMVSALRDELRNNGIPWRVVLSDSIVPKITVSGKSRAVYVNSRVKYTEEEIDRLRMHEVNVHIFRGFNGDLQPLAIFREGLEGYDETEEGLAVAAEDKSGCLDRDTRQLKVYAGRALCVKYCMEYGFYDTFIWLREYFPDDICYRMIERSKRGMHNTGQKGAFTKGYHYISGWLKISKYLEEGGDISILYVGKVGLKHIADLKELLSAGILKGPRHIPDIFR